MTTYLLDVNVLVSLAWPNHVHHRAARRWFRAIGSTSWATTPLTEAGFIRVSSNSAAIPDAVRPADAAVQLQRMRALPAHRFLVDDLEMVLGTEAGEWHEVATHRLVSDAHLLALAKRHGCVLATFDRGAAALARSGVGEAALIDPS